MELDGRKRRAVRVDGLRRWAVAREFRISRKTIRKMPTYAVPRGYQRQQPTKHPNLGPWVGGSMRFWKKTRRIPPRSYQRETVVYDP